MLFIMLTLSWTVPEEEGITLQHVRIRHKISGVMFEKEKEDRKNTDYGMTICLILYSKIYTLQ